ncbi:EamA family transporter, partial [Streptomyces sp. KL116D]|uniref:EamA family transporter n=1 Tax=Streptomyces sp. KL116D TaxID=3045152 RepID=UPI003555D037
MGMLFALASAAFYGIADYAGGLLSRRAHFASVALWGQAGGLVAAVALALVVPATAVGGADLAWGALSGVGSGLGMLFLYRGLGRGAMSVVVPVSAVTGVALSVLVGVWFLGDRPGPLAWTGTVVTVPALWLVSRADDTDGPPSGPATLDALAASAAIAVQYLGLAQAGADSGLWPVA